jgi:hypothetical protein
MAMHPGNGNGLNPHDMPQHLGVVPQSLNSNGYQQPPAHEMHMAPSAPLEAYQHYHPHQVMQHPPLQAAEYQTQQQQHSQHVKHESYDMDQLKNEMPISNVERSTNRRFRSVTISCALCRTHTERIHQARCPPTAGACPHVWLR